MLKVDTTDILDVWLRGVHGRVDTVVWGLSMRKKEVSVC